MNAVVGTDAAALAPVGATIDPGENEAIERQRERRLRRLASRDRISVLVLGVPFASAAVWLATQDSHRVPSLLTVALVVAAYAVAFRVEFEVGTGTAVPTQLVLVPMLFVVPTGWAPLCVAGGIAVACLGDLVTRKTHLERLLLMVVVCSWHAVGPALVLVLAGEGPPRLSRWPIYLGALGAQFALDFGSASVREWVALGVTPKLQLRSMAIVYAVDVALAPVGLALAIAAAQSSAAVLLALPLVALLSGFARERRVRIDHALELGHAYRGTALLLGDVVEADDAYTGSHSRDVVSLSLAVADVLELDSRERHRVELAALLHDVGKIRIPAEIINKPGALTQEERAVIETHTIEGERLLHQVGGLLAEVGRVVRSCHERVDGTGYPDGLVGDRIPLAARVVCACDAFNAMTTDRPYRRALSLEVALAELHAGAGTQFDQAVVDALVSVVSV
ncbi:MAG: hypothetical protein QOG93_1639 [Gaiellaceae bacterium]|nr:hypothetical protein [Gaiellaceae bacterium]